MGGKDEEQVNAVVKNDPGVIRHLETFSKHCWIEWESFFRKKTVLCNRCTVLSVLSGRQSVFSSDILYEKQLIATLALSFL